ncbi:hypothetical protein JCM8547_008898 [Rhodosporidiobolus lusitaniae]
MSVGPPPLPPTLTPQAEPLLTLLLSFALSLVAYKAVHSLVPLLGPDLVAKGLRGRDMLKRGFKKGPYAEGERRGGGGQKRGQGKDEVEDEENEPGRVWIPEATGVIGASVYILLLSLFAPLPYLSSLLPPSLLSSSLSSPVLNTTSFPTPSALPSSTSVPAECAEFVLDLAAGAAGQAQTQAQALAFPHHSFATYLASLLSLLIATFLGFCDDVFDIRWRFKLPIPLIASVPLLVTYAAGHGVTDVVLPNVFGLRELFGAQGTGGVVHLGPLYYLYMSLLSTFCTNSINILAGVNGVEVSQALIIALSLLLNDLLYLPLSLTPLLAVLPVGVVEALPGWVVEVVRKEWNAGFANGSQELQDRHLFSVYFVLPLVGVCVGLLRWNWYPSRVFIGDTFCYFTGMSFAVVGILGHFSKTLLLFFLPQVFNFLLSSPQLFGLVQCPRHRLPRLEERTGGLECSWAPVRLRGQRSAREKVGVGVLRVFEKVGLVGLRREEGTGEITATTNLTVLNVLLLWKGRGKVLTEEGLCLRMIAVQVFGSIVAFAIRYGAAGWFYGWGGERR